MLAILGVASIVGGTCLACVSTRKAHEKRADIVSGLMVVLGLSMIGAMLPV